MGADFSAAHAQASIKGYTGSTTVWLAAAGAEFAAIDQTQPDRPAGASSSSAIHVEATTSVVAGAQAIALTTSAGALADGGPSQIGTVRI